MDSEDDWHEALRRGRPIETPVQLAEQIGVPMNEDVGTLADIIAAADPWAWARFLSLLGKSGAYYARRVADDLIEQIRCGDAPWQKPWGPGERVAPGEFLDRRAIHRRQQCLPAEPGHQARVWRQPLGYLSTD